MSIDVKLMISHPFLVFFFFNVKYYSLFTLTTYPCLYFNSLSLLNLPPNSTECQYLTRKLFNCVFNLFICQVTSVDDIPPPIIQIGPSNQTLPKGSVAMLPCRSTGTPVPQVKWSKDGESLLNRNRFVIVQSGTLKVDGELLLLYD